MHRLFVAIRPPEPIRDRLIDAMDDSPALKWVSDDNLHCTLRFIGEVERLLVRFEHRDHRRGQRTQPRWEIGPLRKTLAARLWLVHGGLHPVESL